MNIIYPKIIYIESSTFRFLHRAMTKSVFTDAYSMFLELLITARKGAGVSQVELAKRLNRPQPFISYIERGERRIDVVEFCVIMRALGIDPASEFAKLLANLPTDIEI